MSQSPFAPPAAPSAGIQWKDYNGNLILFEVQAVKTAIPTSFGEADAVQADVVILDGPNAGEKHENTLVFPKLLFSQLSGRVGQKVLGRLTQGQAKPGQSPPWMLTEATPQDQQTGIAYLNAQLQQPTQPDPQQQPAAAAPTAQQQWQGAPGQQGGPPF